MHSPKPEKHRLRGCGGVLVAGLWSCALGAHAMGDIQLRGWIDDSTLTLAPAPPFFLQADAETRERAVECLADAVYYEAANQSPQGQAAIAQVVLNRVRHPAYPKSICGVVYQGAPYRGCQFTFACDGSLARTPARDAWQTARAVAEHALAGYVETSVGASTHYHTTWVHPNWSATMTPTLRIGAHQFYRFPGAVGGVGALSGVYAGVEPVISKATLIGVAWSPARPSRPLPAIAPKQDEFSVWGLEIATIRPGGGVVRVRTEAAPDAEDGQY